MQVIYNGMDITQQVQIHEAAATDNAGGMADSAEVVFADPEQVWSRWQPKRGDRLELKDSGYSTGLLYVDGLASARGRFTVKALSLPQKARACSSRAWEEIQLLAIAADMAGKYGLSLRVFGAPNPTYKRVEQLNQPDMGFLNGLCLREGCMLKLAGSSMIIYDEKSFEIKAPAITISQGDLTGLYEFYDDGAGWMAQCQVQWFDSDGIMITGLAESPEAGGKLNIIERVESQGEASRFAGGYLRQANKFPSGFVTVGLNTGIAGGNVIGIKDTGLGDGNHFITKTRHDFIGKTSTLALRRPLKGGY